MTDRLAAVRVIRGQKSICKKPTAICDGVSEGCFGCVNIKRAASAAGTGEPASKLKTKNYMKTLVKFVLAAAITITGFAAQAGWVSAYYRSNGTYVAPYYRSDSDSLRAGSATCRGSAYRNPYAADPSVSVSGYYRSTGTYVAPHVRTAPNDTVTDNLSYRGYAPQQPSYVSPRGNPFGSGLTGPQTMPYYGGSSFSTGLLPSTGSYSPKPLSGSSRSSNVGF